MHTYTAGRLFLSFGVLPRSRSADGLRNHALCELTKERDISCFLLPPAVSFSYLVSLRVPAALQPIVSLVALPIARAPRKRQVRTEGQRAFAAACTLARVPTLRRQRPDALFALRLIPLPSLFRFLFRTFSFFFSFSLSLSLFDSSSVRFRLF